MIFLWGNNISQSIPLFALGSLPCFKKGFLNLILYNKPTFFLKVKRRIKKHAAAQVYDLNPEQSSPKCVHTIRNTTRHLMSAYVSQCEQGSL